MTALPARPSLQRLRREARAFQRACLAGDPDSRRRLIAVLPQANPKALALAHAQLVIARGYGFPSWPALRAEVAARKARKPASAADLDARTLAERWFGLADAGDLRRLAIAMAVGKARKQAARRQMQATPGRYAAFQAALVDGLSAHSPRTRFECAGALDTFGDQATRAPLVRLIEDATPRVRWMAIHALSCHACGEKAFSLEDDVRERIADAALADASPHVRRHAAVALGLARAAEAAPALRRMLADEVDARPRQGAAWALAQLGHAAKPAPGGV